FDDGHAAAAVADRLGQRRGVRRGEEAPAGVVGDAPQERRPHRGVEVLGVAGRHAHVHRRGAELLVSAPAGTRGIDAHLIYAVFLGAEAGAVLAVLADGPVDGLLGRLA